MLRKYHKSPKTGRWAVCKADTCPYGDIPTSVYATLKPLLTRKDLPIDPRVQLHTVQTSGGEVEAIAYKPEYRTVPEGYTALACPTCGAYLPKGYWEATVAANGGQRVPCPNAACDGHGFGPEEYIIDAYPSELKYWDAAEVQKAHWFHVTTRENWLEDAIAGVDEAAKTEGTVFVHVGSRASAIERMHDLIREHTKKPELSGKAFYLYEVKLASKTPVNPKVLEDAIDGWPELIVEKPSAEDFASRDWEAQARVLDWQIQEHYQRDGVSAYLNTCEAPGTISLIANPTKLVQVDRQVIPLPA